MTDIETIGDLQRLVAAGETDWKKYGEVGTATNGDLILFNYLPTAVYANRWNYFEQISRGLILNRKSGNVVARPFDKFWNWGEGGRMTSAGIRSVTQKVDGSLGILYRQDGQLKIATRGSFTSEQALWATEYLKRYDLSSLDPDLTLLFEIVYPENRIVVDYGDTEALVFLAARNMITGKYERDYLYAYDWFYLFDHPDCFLEGDIDDIIARLPELDANEEGYVVEFLDGQRFKFKGARYLELHRLISNLSFKNTLAAVACGTVENIRSQVSDEFLGQFNQWVEEIKAKEAEIERSVTGAFAEAPKASRKDFALWVMANYKDLAQYLFAMLDGQDIAALIYRKAFDNRKERSIE